MKVVNKVLAKYQTGNVTITLLENGTKIQEWPDDEAPQPKLPISMDIKITNCCDLNCAWCHEESNIHGEHANLNVLMEILKDFPKGTELALGGGNPLAHPELIEFLMKCKEFGFIPNLTVNYGHIKKYHTVLNSLIENKYIYGLGISIPDTYNEEIIDLIKDTSNVVFHVIAGVNHASILEKIKKSKVNKVLILGYKNYGKGQIYHNLSVNKGIEEWKFNLIYYLRKMHLSFDNLAIAQLEVAAHLSEGEWETFFMGNDGVFTMYIDAVKQEYAKSSITTERVKFSQTSIKEFFKSLKL